MNRHFILFAIVFAAALSGVAKTFDWPIDATAAGARQFTAYHGETVRFNLQFRGAMTNLVPVCIYYQTNGMNKAEWFEPLPGTVFHPTNDCGAAFYRFFIRCTDPDGVNYTANGTLRLLDSPGFEPSAVQLPAKTIDFATVEVLNAPYYDKAETESKIVELAPAPDYSTNNAELVATIEATAPAPGNYAAVSNAAMYALSRAEAGLSAWSLTPAPHGPWSIQYEAANGSHTGGWYLVIDDQRVGFYEGGETSTTIEFTDYTATRTSLPTMKDIPTAQINAATTTNALQDAAIAEKQDNLPYPTNAIPYAAISGKPSLATVATSGSYNDLSNKPTIPTVPTNVSAFNNDAGYLTSYTESDPTVPSWAKASSKPTYTASEVGALPSSTTHLSGDVPTSRKVNNKPLTGDITLQAADVGAYPNASGEALAGQVSAIGATLHAGDAHFVSPNYDSNVHLPEAYVEVKMRDEATGSNTWITIWQEMRRWTAFVGSAFDWSAWSGFHAWATNITHELSFKADRCWGIYDSETGGYSPEGYTQISSSNILIAAGMAYQRTVTSGGAVWVLQCNQGTAHVGGDTNGFFRVVDGDGVTQFEIIKGDKREMGADASGITVGSGTPPVVTIPYSVEADEHPTLQVCDNLTTANWKAETDSDCLATVSWSGVSGAYVATVQRKTIGNELFVKASYMAGGETYIKNVAPVSAQGGILCTDGIHKCRAVYSNGSIIWEVVP